MAAASAAGAAATSATVLVGRAVEAAAAVGYLAWLQRRGILKHLKRNGPSEGHMVNVHALSGLLS